MEIKRSFQKDMESELLEVICENLNLNEKTRLPLKGEIGYNDGFPDIKRTQAEHESRRKWQDLTSKWQDLTSEPLTSNFRNTQSTPEIPDVQIRPFQVPDLVWNSSKPLETS